jgi:transcriptional regulator with XRE-family HTH domain
MKDQLYMEVRYMDGSRLRAVRESKGLTVTETAKRAGIAAAHLSRVERGKRGLSVESLARLARVLDLRDLERLLRVHIEGMKK